eukprot:TRINITY_DN34339_c0_g1_i2.p1 TRINITY_DN34339_c0_g1~~TRINITY_DN34339_c0_g1_i2.p1  ORF type:complete len:1015 (+),score=196.93 TRINITY_DN34339_c0_g1_i2:103-3147(+)
MLAHWLLFSLIVLPFVLPFFLVILCCPCCCCCPRRLKQSLGAFIVRNVLVFRYNIRVTGLSTLVKNGKGILFLPNHPALIDPFMVMSYLHKRFRVRPLVAEAQVEKKPWFFKLAEALAVPDFGEGTNSYTMHLMEQVKQNTLSTLEGGENVLLYPSGRLMRSGTHFNELSASAVFDLIQKRKDAGWRVVLIYTDGLWGSRFSTAYQGKTPDFVTELKGGVGSLLANLLVFMPKRRVDMVFEEVEVPDFPDKVELNKWLMSKYNAGGDETLAKPGEDGYRRGKGRVPYRCCSPNSVKALPENKSGSATDLGDEDLDPKLVETVLRGLGKHLGKPRSALALSQSLSYDLGLDSIQLGELLGWLDEEFNVQDVNATELSTVSSVVQVVAGKSSSTAAPRVRPAAKGWTENMAKRPEVIKVIKGDSLPEAFLLNAKRMGTMVAVGDDISGALPYDRFLIGAILFAEYLRAHPERLAHNRIGVMMPAAAGVGVIIMGVMLAGCAPVMVNWTVGRASLEHVLQTTGIKTVITAKSFLKKLGPEVDLTCLLETEGLLLFIEDLKASFGTFAKLRGKLLSMKSAKSLHSRYNLQKITRDDEAVVLFTSGSESFPKGVPLSHGNILSNIQGMINVAGVRNTDCLYGVLPPFHSFGFTVTTMGPMVSGVKVAYYPNPTEYRRIAREMARWRPSIYLGTPTFTNGILQASKADYEKSCRSTTSNEAAATNVGKARWPTSSLRLCVTGAEKTPEALFQLASNEHRPPIEVIEGYGITETSPVLTANRPQRPRAGVGWALDGSRLALLETEPYLAKEWKIVATCSSDGAVVGPTGKQGIIIASGPGVFGKPDASPPRAYLGIPLEEKNPFIFLDGTYWYDTGDLGYFDGQGALHLAGRMKRFVKVAGEMVSLVQLEVALKKKTLQDGSKPWEDIEEGPVVAVEAMEQDGERPIFGLISAVDATVDGANEQLQAEGMPRIAKISFIVDSRTEFDARWAEQGTLPLLGTGKSDYAAMKRAVARRVKEGL